MFSRVITQRAIRARVAIGNCGFRSTAVAQAPISDYNLADVLDSEESSPSKRISTCRTDTPVPEAVRAMKEAEVGAILVTEEDTVRGILSEKDYVLHLNHGAFCPSSIVAAHVMTPKVVSGTNDTPILDAIEWMLTRKVRHMPVLAAGDNAGSNAGTSHLPPVDSDSGSEDDAAEAVDAVNDAGERMPLGNVSAVLSLRALLSHVLRVLESEEAVRGAAAEKAQAVVDAARTALDEAAAAADAAKDAEGDKQAEGGEGGGHALDAAKATLKEAKAALHDLGPAHRAFRLDLEDVLEWQRENGVEHLLNCRVEDEVTAADAANEMAEAGVTSLVVVDDEGTLVGILTSRDYLWRVVAAQAASAEAQAVAAAADGGDEEALLSSPVFEGAPTPSAAAAGGGVAPVEEGGVSGAQAGDATALLVADVMTSPVKTSKASWSLIKAAKFMLRKRVRHIAVTTEERKMLGIVSMSDLMRVMLADDLAAKEQQAGRVRVRRTRDFFNVRLLSGRKGVAAADDAQESR